MEAATRFISSGFCNSALIIFFPFLFGVGVAASKIKKKIIIVLHLYQIDLEEAMGKNKERNYLKGNTALSGLADQ